LESGQQFEREHSGCVRDDLFDISEDHSTESCRVKLGVYDEGGNCFGGVKVKVRTQLETQQMMTAQIIGHS